MVPEKECILTWAQRFGSMVGPPPGPSLFLLSRFLLYLCLSFFLGLARQNLIESDYILTYVLLLVQAIRDHEYMGRFSGQRHDPFKVSSERAQDRWLLDQLITDRKGKLVRHFEYLKKTSVAAGPWESGRGSMRPIGGTRGEAFRRAFASRVAGGIVGAAFLIGPMWLLVLRQDIYLQLGVTTGCILAFSLVMVVALKTLEAVFAATLAYAAVLMVFVGVVMQSSGGDS